MQVHTDIDGLPKFRNAVITIGTFDGVHRGHREIIERMRAEANIIGGESVLVTFHPHPRKVVSSAILGIRLINTLQERLELLGELGIDHVVVTPFTDAFANQTAEDYVRNFLVQKFRPHTIIVGYDHRFGRERRGDYHLLEQMAPSYGYRLREIPKHIVDEISISSTKIRAALLEGRLDAANRLLGYEFFFSGIVVDGDKLGRKLGYPTANLRISDEEKIIPGNGIYAVYARVGSEAEKRKGMMSIGFRPTVDGKKRVIEVNMFDFDRQIYGEQVTVYVRQYLREELKFDSIEALVEQIGRDKTDSLAVL
ncbi:MAG TPA: bifunctional riboflavin kinase/FAD synthetase [Chitinophagaceae bacterium]|nr:bifunctional riboflavin kinase/FAD synthetase [Chitinophagaceae bacterium]